MIFRLIRSQSIILFWNSDPRFVLRHIFGIAWYRLSVASWIVGLASIGLASDPQNRGTPRDCRLMINWDQFNMTALPLTYVHLDADPEPEKVKALIEEIEMTRLKWLLCGLAIILGTLLISFLSC